MFGMRHFGSHHQDRHAAGRHGRGRHHRHGGERHGRGGGLGGGDMMRAGRMLEQGDRRWQVEISGQLRKAEEYLPLIVRYRDGARP